MAYHKSDIDSIRSTRPSHIFNNNNNNNVLFQTNVHIQYTNIKNTYINKHSTKNNITINIILVSTIVGLESG